jgi:hypothetical protein
VSPRQVDRGTWGEEPIRETRSRAKAPDVNAIALEVLAGRPIPPDDVAEDELQRFVPDQRFAEWIRETFILPTGALANEDHAHLIDARIGVLWTNAVNLSKMRQVIATAELPQVIGSAWRRGRAEQQLRDWFELELHFLLTFYAPAMEHLSDREFCAVVEHELYHCAQKEDRFGAPAFDTKTGEPIFAMRGHDVEEFVGVVRRYGTTGNVRELVEAANRTPIVRDDAIAHACGTCDARVA